MPAFRSFVPDPSSLGEKFLYELKAGPAGGLRPPSGPAATRRSPGTGLTHPTPAYSHLDGDPDVHSPWLLGTHRRVRREPAPLRLGRAPHDPRAQHRRHCALFAHGPFQRRRAHRDPHAPTVPTSEVAVASTRAWGTPGACSRGTAADNHGHPRTTRHGGSSARTPLSCTCAGTIPSMACKGSGVQIPSAPLITTAQVAALYCCSTSSPRAPRQLEGPGPNPPTGSRAARRSRAGRGGGG
jgi:hypothetical protein